MEYIENNISEKPVHIGVTQSFLGDLTYQPRFPASDKIQVKPLMLKPPFNSLEYLNYELDYIIFSDYAINVAGGETAPFFIHEITQGNNYQHIKSFTPPGFPVTFTGLLNLRKPDDLLYTRLSFFIYERISQLSEEGGFSSEKKR